ncbi:MAG: hypothetical protein ABI693_11670 [Bryobacteraceae bacterium]
MLRFGRLDVEGNRLRQIVEEAEDLFILLGGKVPFSEGAPGGYQEGPFQRIAARVTS